VEALGKWRRARRLPVYPITGGTGIDIDRICVAVTLRLD
jgi:hypothetical protein